MNSDNIKTGAQRAPHRSLLYALGLTKEELERPIIAVVNAQSEVIPGHLHLDTVARAAADGIRMAGGTPIEVPAIGVCDGIAMNLSLIHISAALPGEYAAIPVSLKSVVHVKKALFTM